MKTKKRILFICKDRNTSYTPSFGLLNSCKFICNALEKHYIECKVVAVVDNNAIDKEVTSFQPTHVFIEALWVVPSKFNVLCALHPNVKWYVRIHSKVPFLANEGMAMGWIRDYAEISHKFKNLHNSANNMEVIDAFKKHLISISNFTQISMLRQIMGLQIHTSQILISLTLDVLVLLDQ
jgi:hypothetical protein